MDAITLWGAMRASGTATVRGGVFPDVDQLMRDACHLVLVLFYLSHITYQMYVQRIS